MSDTQEMKLADRLRAMRKMASEESRHRYKDPMMNKAFEATSTEQKVKDLPEHTQELIRAAQKAAGKKLPVGKDHLNRLRTMRKEVMPVVLHTCPIGYHEFEKPYVDQGEIMVTRKGTFCAPSDQTNLGEDLTAAAWTPKKKSNALDTIHEIKYMLQEILPGAAAEAHREKVTKYMEEVKKSQKLKAETKEKREEKEREALKKQIRAIATAQRYQNFDGDKFLEQCKTMRQVQKDTTQLKSAQAKQDIKFVRTKNGREVPIPAEMGKVIEQGQEQRKKVRAGEATEDTVVDLAPLADFYRSYMKILERRAAEEEDMGLKIIDQMSVDDTPSRVVIVSPSEIMGKTMSASRSPNMADRVASVLRRKGLSSDKSKTYVPGRGVVASKSLEKKNKSNDPDEPLMRVMAARSSSGRSRSRSPRSRSRSPRRSRRRSPRRSRRRRSRSPRSRS